MQKFPRRWDKITCINFLQRKIIILSIAYYELSQNLIDDSLFDKYCKQLVSMHKEHGDISDTEYGYAFGDDFDGSTGFYLYYNLNEHDKEYLYHITYHIIHHNSFPEAVHVTQQTPKKKGKLF